MAMEREAAQKAKEREAVQKAQFNNIPQNVFQPVSVPSVSWFTVFFIQSARVVNLTHLKRMSLSKNKKPWQLTKNGSNIFCNIYYMNQ